MDWHVQTVLNSTRKPLNSSQLGVVWCSHSVSGERLASPDKNPGALNG
jgi:hypothetical protein